jgi:Ca2+-transporting ATPase
VPGGLWRRWVVASTSGELAGFLLPAVVAAGAGGALVGLPGLGLMVLAGAGEGAVLGWAQGRVLERVLPGLDTRDWTVRTAVAAALAWALGMAPSSLGDAFAGLPPGLRIAVAAPAGVVLLLSIGVAQWTVLRRHVPGAARWIGWTAAGWLAGLAVFLAVATPLWQPGQDVVLVAAVGVLAGSLMAVTMAALTGWGLARLLRRAPAPA